MFFCSYFFARIGPIATTVLTLLTQTHSPRDESDDDDDYLEDEDDRKQMTRGVLSTAASSSNPLTLRIGWMPGPHARIPMIRIPNSAVLLLMGAEEAAKGITASTSRAGKTAFSSKRQKVEKLTHSFVVSVC